MKIVFFILLILLFTVLIVLWFPVRAKGVMHANLLKKEAFFSIKVLFINISAKLYVLSNNHLSIIHNADHFLDLNTDNINGVVFAKEMFKQAKIKNLDIIIDGGKQDDAFLTAMAISSADAFLSALASALKPKIESCRIKTLPSYQSSELIVSFRARVGVRVIDAIRAYIISKKEKQKGVQNA